jgi:hypothetical protein
MKNKLVFRMVLSLAFLVLFASLQPAYSQQPALQQYWSGSYNLFNPITTNDYQWNLVRKAQPDECFFSVGDPNNRASFIANYPGDLPTGYTRPCAFNNENGIPKVNQAYLWGLTKHGRFLWFGTIANTLCLVMEAMGLTQPLQENTVVCEGGSSDLRPPRIFMYDTTNDVLTDMTSLVLDASVADAQRLTSTVGLRSAGSLGDVVFLGGISFKYGVTMFAFNARTKAFIGSAAFPTYSNIRQWIVVNKQLYVGVANGTSSGIFANTSGAILHWIGDSTNPFQFEQVGAVPGDPAYLTHYADRIFVSTWGGPDGSYGTVLSMSPKFST